MAAATLPTILKHCTIAIFGRTDTKGSGLSKFKNAWMIARWALTKQGYLSSGSDAGATSGIKLTGKGRQREATHQREGAQGVWKDKMFDELFSQLEEEDDQHLREEEEELLLLPLQP